MPYKVKASKFLSFSALDASLLLNQASQRQKIAQPSVFKSLRLAGRGGGGDSWGGGDGQGWWRGGGGDGVEDSQPILD